MEPNHRFNGKPSALICWGFFYFLALLFSSSERLVLPVVSWIQNNIQTKLFILGQTILFFFETFYIVFRIIYKKGQMANLYSKLRVSNNVSVRK